LRGGTGQKQRRSGANEAGSQAMRNAR